MLVLTRRIGERVVIGENVEVEIVEIRGGKVRLGVAAPVEIPVHRKEVHRPALDESVDVSEQDGSARENLRRAV